MLYPEELEAGNLTSLCGRMFYYDGEHLSVRLADFAAYDDDCPEHDRWEPIGHTALSLQSTVEEALTLLREELEANDVTLCLTSDCYVDYVSERANNRRTTVMRPGREVKAFVEQDANLRGFPLSGLYQHEYREIGPSFPYLELTLAQLGIPNCEVLHVEADGKDCYLEIKER